ncbi:MAG: AAA family ATPase [Acidimicrobiales bacterium]
MVCASCGGSTPEGKRFCKDCGAPLLTKCPACGTEVLPGARFCADCGSPVGGGLQQPPPASEPPETAGRGDRGEAEPVAAELRHVSVLFCDIVGFTPLAESADPAEVREFLSGYFEVARSVIGRYGGIIEKFIGDAVMAVWGVPVANEDDAERAVRAGLDLVAAIATYGKDAGSELQARVGIVTGRAATAASTAEGLVIGDRVNTAARIQAAASPGCCYVDETTRAATTAAIAYGDRGLHELKGKSQAAHLYEALRVVAAVAGSQRSSVIEAPFTGRDHELRLLKELFHASVERSSARLALVSGVAGIGKSRLAWELFKYTDGLAQRTLWHTGRCLSYGDGVSYWALSEMVRARLQIGEEDPVEVAEERLRAGLERWISSTEDQEFIGPRLAQLLGLPTDAPLMREELFAGWRLFFERLAEHLPVVMVVEDLQWADQGLVEFLDQLLDWSADHAIFLLVLTRPEASARPGLVLSRRNVTALSIDPLSNKAVGDMLDGLVSDLPPEGRQRIVERAEGIPLYAVETVRALLDRGVLARNEDGSLHVAGELGSLDIPPELTALISSRLDTLGPRERQLVKECAVLGDSFPRHAVEAVTDLEHESIDELLASLVRREVLAVRADKLSPERGQYAFTQSLIRSVAYDMLTNAERKARHLRTAAHLQNAFADDGSEVSEVIAAHLQDAYRAAAGDADAEEIGLRAELSSVSAAERADAIGAYKAAEAAYLRAAELAGDETRRGHHLVKASRMAIDAEDHRAAIEHGEAAGSVFEALGDVLGVAEAALSRAMAAYFSGHSEEAIETIHGALSSVEGHDPGPLLEAELNLYLGIACAFTGKLDLARKSLDTALLVSQQYEFTEQLAMGLNFKSIVLRAEGRREEARLFLEASVEVARGAVPRMEGVTENNLGWFHACHDLPGAEEHLRRALAIARRRGSRQLESAAADSLIYVLVQAGRFVEATQLANEVLAPADALASRFIGWLDLRLACLDALGGRVEAARLHLARCEEMATAAEVQTRGFYAVCEATVELAANNPEAALDAASRAMVTGLAEGSVSGEGVREALPIALDAALLSGQTGRLPEFLDEIESRPPGESPPVVRIHVRRARALMAAARGETEGVESALREAEGDLAALGYEYWRARAELDLAEWLAKAGRNDEAAVRAGAAAESFGRLGANPLRERAEAVLTAGSASTTSSVRGADRSALLSTS